VTADSHCPECRGRPDLIFVKIDRLVRRCVECGHRWNEEREPQPEPMIRKGGYIYRD
jgi:Zn ribbon nucleic-acid-binding protein